MCTYHELQLNNFIMYTNYPTTESQITKMSKEHFKSANNKQLTTNESN